MNDLELRIRVQSTIESMLDSLARQGVSFTMMEDALYKNLTMVKDRAYQELITSVSVPVPAEEDSEKEE